MINTDLDYRELILQGIKENGGHEDDIQHLDPLWFKALGVKAANIAAIRQMKFPSWVVEPICDMGEAVGRSNHTNGTLDPNIRLPQTSGAKRVHVVFFDRALTALEYIERLQERALKPCIDGPSYLAGLMAKIPRSEMPPEIASRWIVAAEPGKHVRWNFMGSHSGYLYAAIAPNGHCSFDACGVPPVEVFPTHWDIRWAFLAEAMSP